MADLPEGYSIRQAAPAAPQGLPEGYSVRTAQPSAGRSGGGGYGEPPPRSVSPRAEKVYGLDPTIKRSTIVPLGVNEAGGTEFAVPKIGVDVMESLLVPGRAAPKAVGGGEETITPEEAAKFTLDIGVPGSRAVSVGRRALTRGEVIAAAPKTKELLAAGGKTFETARATGAKLSPDDFTDFLAKVETTLNEEGVDQFTKSAFPKLSGVVDSLMARLGREPDIRDLQIMRKQVLTAVNSRDLDEARIGRQVLDQLDETVDNLSGLPKEARAMWAAGKKSQTIENIVEVAEGQASGFENGLRIGFRALLKDKKALRGFAKDEIAAMQQIRDGTAGQKALRLLGGLGPKRSGDANSLRMLAGIGAGGMAGGPIGAMAVPALGAAAGKLSERATLRNTEFLRALSATGGQSGRATSDLPRNLEQELAAALALAGPVAGTQLPTMTQPQSDQDKLARLLAGGAL
jgi:hypothetical protein